MQNLIRTYADLLDLTGLNPFQSRESLRKIFDRDIQDNNNFKFQKKIIRPIKKDGHPSMDTVFLHLTTQRVEVEENGKKFKRAQFDQHRSLRLHWVRFHIDRGEHEEVEIFSVMERDQSSRKDIINTYIYNREKLYVIVLRPQDSGMDYYLLSAYYLNEKWAASSIESKLKKKLEQVY